MKRFLRPAFAALLIAALPGCGPETAGPDGTDGDHHDHGAEGAGASFVEGRGIVLIDETSRAIGLELAEAGEQKLSPLVPINAQVYRAAGEPSRAGGEQTGFAYATALLDSALAEKLAGGEPATLGIHDASYEATVWRIDPVSKEAVNSIEAILQIPDPRNTLAVGEFVSGFVRESAAEETVLTVPRSAVLETAAGKFAFVQNGDYLLRTPVTVGAENAEYAEITGGIYAGDVVAANPVETLYLIELRATKGGGHSH
ncbi:MAG: hypothetical protein IAE97_02325 [Chthoniobacterales bacterium]|nr:hypothetical protein [Chthoniobacterales bacterium]